MLSLGKRQSGNENLQRLFNKDQNEHSGEGEKGSESTRGCKSKGREGEGVWAARITLKGERFLSGRKVCIEGSWVMRPRGLRFFQKVEKRA